LSISVVKAPWASSLTSSSKRYSTLNVVCHDCVRMCTKNVRQYVCVSMCKKTEPFFPLISSFITLFAEITERTTLVLATNLFWVPIKAKLLLLLPLQLLTCRRTLHTKPNYYYYCRFSFWLAVAPCI
jgi:hypothetical protein